MTTLHEQFCDRIELSHNEFCNWLKGKIAGPLRQRFDAEDLLQEIMAKCPKQVADLLQLNDEKFRRWIRTALCYRLNTIIRRNRGVNYRRDTVSIDSFDPVDTHDNPEEQAIRREKCELLRAKLNALGRTDRSVIIARCIKHYSIDVIAQRLGISESACRQRIGRAKRRLRDLLA